MNEHETIEPEVEDDEETGVKDTGKQTENVGEISVEINVQDLIAEIESEANSDESNHDGIRRKLEKLLDRKNIAKALEDFDDYDLDN